MSSSAICASVGTYDRYYDLSFSDLLTDEVMLCIEVLSLAVET